MSGAISGAVAGGGARTRSEGEGEAADGGSDKKPTYE